MLRRRAVGLTIVALAVTSMAACSGDDATIGSPVSSTIANVGTDLVPGDSGAPQPRRVCRRALSGRG